MPVPVLLLVRELGIGGGERDLTKIATHLERERFEPHVACFRREGLRTAELEQAGVPILHLPVRSFRSPSAVREGRRLAAYIRRHGIRLVHAFDAPTNVFAIPLARALGVPAISSQLGSRELTGGFMRQLLRVTDRLADAVLVNCQALERHLVTDEKVPAGRIRLCYNGVDPAEFHPAAGDRPEPLRGASLVIGTVCALRPEKRVDLLLEAFARVRARAANPRLAVVGSGPLLGELQARSAALGLEECCVFEPALPRVAGWMRAMDIFVLPSSSEAFSNALLEAMACGCCPVGSQVGGTPELIQPGETGLLFPSGDAGALAARLEMLIRREELRRKLAAAAARSARERFSIDIAAARMSAIYEGLLQPRRMVRAA